MKISSYNVIGMLALCWISLSEAQVLLPGQCANHNVVQNFNIASYLGVWYEIENTPTEFEQADGICVQADYSDFGNGSVRVLNSLIDPVSGEVRSALGRARPSDPSRNEGKLLVNFPFTGTAEAPYWVLDTDYVNYSIVWSCRNANDGVSSYQTFWFLSRSRTPTEAVRGYVRGFLTALNFDLSLLEETTQTGCPNLENLID